MYSLRGVAEFGGGRTQNRKTNKEYDFRLSEKQRALLRRKPAHETGFRTDRLDRLDDDGTGYSRTRRQGHLRQRHGARAETEARRQTRNPQRVHRHPGSHPGRGGVLRLERAQGAQEAAGRIQRRE